MDPYPTSLGRELSLLAQVGISTNSSSFGGSLDATKLRGYIEINEQTLDAALTEKLDAVKELFGSDTNNDLVVDSGVAFAIDAYTRGFTQTGESFPQRYRDSTGPSRETTRTSKTTR
jgi:flagellar hook-associated protein 2